MANTLRSFLHGAALQKPSSAEIANFISINSETLKDFCRPATEGSILLSVLASCGTENLSWAIPKLLEFHLNNLPASIERAFYAQVAHFFRHCSSETAEANPAEITKLGRSYFSSVHSSTPRSVVLPFRDMAAKFTFLTPIHSLFMQTAVACRAYLIASDFLKAHPQCTFRVCPNSNITAQEVLQFFYHAGLVKLNRNEHIEAIDYFGQCLCVPSNRRSEVVSQISIAAHKKFLLAAMLNANSDKDENHVKFWLSHMAPLAKRLTEHFGSTYLHLRKLFELDNSLRFDTLVAQHESELVADGNMGLCQQARLKMVEKRISRLAGSYTSLNMKKLTHLVQANLNLNFLLDQIQNGRLACKLQHVTQSDRNDVLLDLNHHHLHLHHQSVEHVAHVQDLSQSIATSGMINDFLNQISCSQQYIRKMMEKESMEPSVGMLEGFMAPGRREDEDGDDRRAMVRHGMR